MARNGPLITLLAGGALGIGLLVASMAAASDDGDPPAADPSASPSGVAGDTPSPTEEPTAAPSPDETAEPDPDDQADATDAPDPAEPAQTLPPAEADEPVTYVGYVDSGEASVAVIVTGDEAIAYVCDGASREAWLSGSASDGTLELSGDRGSLSATFDGFVAEGRTTVDGQSWTFAIAIVESPAGLYRFADTIAGGAEVVGGWIVLPDGDQIGAVSVDGETQPAGALDVSTGRVTVEGDVVTAERQG